MRGRMLHTKSKSSGSQKVGLQAQDYGFPAEGEVIRSISRGVLGIYLLDHVDGLPKEGRGSVKTRFETKLVEMDLRGEEAVEVSLGSKDGSVRKEKFDFVVGGDGAYSRVRREMMRGSKARFNYKQSYAPHAYLELAVPAGPNSTFSISPNHLHIWPRGEFMLIALPNQDKSFTLTLFAHQSTFDELDSKLRSLSSDAVNPVVDLFRTEFPDALELMGEEELLKSWRENPKDGLITVECSPYHYKDKALLIGDAAHAMVPFYGQGMNCGFEDVRFLSTLLDHFSASPSPLIPSPLPYSSITPSLPSATPSGSSALETALTTYTTLRAPSLKAIQTLAANNYSEMASSVLNPFYLLRLTLDGALSSLFRLLPAPRNPVEGMGGTWESLYRMTTFRWGLAYEEVLERRRWQQRVLEAGVGVSVVGLGVAGVLGWRKWGGLFS
ncbi:hypothetical protein BCR35DRAFT_307992, partial [Leucosporidium creatinivorum]